MALLIGGIGVIIAIVGIMANITSTETIIKEISVIDAKSKTEESEREYPISYADIWDAYREGQPYSFHWTNCDEIRLLAETGSTPETYENAISIIPRSIFLDKNNNAAVVPFLIDYYFMIRIISIETEDVSSTDHSDEDDLSYGHGSIGGDGVELYSGYVAIEGFVLFPSERDFLELNLEPHLDKVRSQNGDRVSIIFDKMNYAPYSVNERQKVMDYIEYRDGRIFAEFVRGSNGWVTLYSEEYLCKPEIYEHSVVKWN